jgi:ABC-type sugar transport system permease subunit
MVYASVVITILSYVVWLRHFFTMGSGAGVNSFFGIATMVIAIPTGAMVFNWLFTMYRGEIRFELPMMWLVAFMLTFVVGGMTGVLLAVPLADFVLHNTLFLVAHFHNVIIGGVVFVSIMLIVSWIGVGYWMTFLLAGLQEIPKSLYEAVRTDGTNRWQQFRYVTLPQLRRPLTFVLVANTVANFLVFAPAQILPQGGPQGSTNLIMNEVYSQAFV